MSDRTILDMFGLDGRAAIRSATAAEHRGRPRRAPERLPAGRWAR